MNQVTKLRTRLGGIRWKLFGLISVVVAVPVALLTAYFPARYAASLEDALSVKARAFTRMLDEPLRAAIAFDDVITAREAFASTATDPDVVSLALFRANGSLLAVHGDGPRAAPAWTDAAVLEEVGARLRVTAPVIADEGPRGLLVLDLSAANVEAESAHALRFGIALGAMALVLGCIAAWLVGISLGRRIERVRAQAVRVAAGDLTRSADADASPDEIGEMARAFDAMIEVVDKKVAERTDALRESRESYRSLLETTRTIPWQMRTDDWRFTYVGPQAEALFGGTSEERLSKRFWMNHVPEEDRDEIIAHFLSAVADGSEREAEFRFLHDDGSCRWIRILVSDGGDGGVLQGFMLDATKQRALEQELRQSQKLESVGRLAAGVAHEINTPIQFVSHSVHFVRDAFADLWQIVGGIEGLADELEEVGLGGRAEELRRAIEAADLEYLEGNVPLALDRSIEGLERVASIVRSMKEFAHPSAGAQAPADLNRMLEVTADIARNEYKYVAEVEMDLGALPSVRCFAGELNQVFLNVIVNAAHAIADVVGTSDERGRIRISTRLEGEVAVVAVSDTGTGMSESVRARVFDPFFTTKEVGRGTGQGLAIARNVVVDKHAGSISLESELGVGTTVFIRVPVQGVKRPTKSPAPNQEIQMVAAA